MEPKSKIKEKNPEFQGVADRLLQIRNDVFVRATNREIGLKDGLGNKLTQAEMANLANCKAPTWAEYESAKALPAPKVIQALIELGYDANWILCGKGQMRLADGDWTLNKIALNTVIQAVMTEIEKTGAKLSPVGISGIIGVAYDSYRKNDDVTALATQVGQLVVIASMGGQQ
ncbi:helix-turn-helix transcriptional regulator [Geobacter sp.]|uniref:helix-turn-helix domain-containing protein n=1 Tax=Geobacter sp. TaxID=46610 RepID=UPI001AD45647|nr:helix-turn-helix transcriptional regulator [Geobacter sp.]CAG1771699.1 hypothetical protein BAC3_02003 [uncultured bacterium]